MTGEELDAALGRLALDALEDPKAPPPLRDAAERFIIDGEDDPFRTAIIAGAWALRLRELSARGGDALYGAVHS